MTHAVYVSPQMGIFTTTCEVLDTPDPETKIFRFKEWPGIPDGWHYNQGGLEKDGAGGWRPVGALRIISVYSASEYDRTGKGRDMGEELGRYRVTAKLPAPDGYVGVYEGTTLPEEKESEPEPTPDSGRAITVEDMILSALDSVPRMTLRDLKRKLSAHRYPLFDECLRGLADEGALTIEPDAEYPKRMWVGIKA